MTTRRRRCVLDVHWLCACLCGPQWPIFLDPCLGTSISILPWVNYIWAESSRGGELESAIATAEPVGFIELELEMCQFSYLRTSGA